MKTRFFMQRSLQKSEDVYPTRWRGGYELTDKARTILENIQTKVQSAVPNFDELLKQTIDEEIQQAMY